ncbi:MAG TPA: M56 family metallopeptidase [Pirellulales bacterium]|nr:M56 family metallopeptidase [Pirellulales bacterium]
MIDALNSWAESWSDWALAALVEGTLLFAVASLVWRLTARRASSQFGYLLFLLVLVRLAVPIAVAVPAGWGWLSPRDALGRAVAWLGEDRAAKANPRATMPESIEPAPPELSADWLTAHADLLPRAAESNSVFAQPASAASLSFEAWLMLLWAGVAAVLLVRLFREQAKWARRFDGAPALDAAALPLDYTALCRRVGLRRRVAIIGSSAVESPAVWGVFCPRLVAPPGLVERLPREQLAWVLAHELAHVRRGDLWVVLAQRLLQIVYFFHPAVWLANRAIDRQREYACDDAAFAAVDCAGRDCGSALVSVAAWALGESPQPALGLFSAPSLLKRRVSRLLAARPETALRLSPASLAALAIAALLVLPHVRAAESAAAKKPNGKAAATQDDTAPTAKPASDETRAAAPKKAPGEAKAPNAPPSLEARAAALKAIRQARGWLSPDPEAFRTSGLRFAEDPRNEFVTATFAGGPNTDGALANLIQFPELQRVQLRGNKLTEAGLTHVGRLKNLTWLGLNFTPTDDRGLSRLAALDKLQTLDLSQTKVTGRGMQWLTLLKNLRSLELDVTVVDDDGLRRLAGLDALENLGFSDTKITDAGLTSLSKLPNLAGLSLRGDAITDAGAEHLSRLKKLKSLDLDGTQITDAGLQQLDPPRKLTTLYVRNTRIGDASADWISKRTNLAYLDLGNTGITDAGLAKLAGLTRLEYLSLAGTQITDEGLKSLAGCAKLKVLRLVDTAISDAGLAHLKPLTALENLDLSGTKIADPRLEPLKALPRLAQVGVRSTSLTDSDVYRALPQTNPNVRKILAALEENTELEFVDQPLSDVVEYLRERHDIQIQLDIRSLVKAKKNADLPITMQYRGGPLSEALKRLFAKYDLAMAIRHEVLMIGAKPLSPEPPSLPILPAGEKLSPIPAKALAELTELEFVEQPLSDVVEYLKERHDIEIVLDNEALTKAGIGSDTPVTRVIRGITLKSALELMLGELDLTCFAEGDRLVVRPIP